MENERDGETIVSVPLFIGAPHVRMIKFSEKTASSAGSFFATASGRVPQGTFSCPLGGQFTLCPEPPLPCKGEGDIPNGFLGNRWGI